MENKFYVVSGEKSATVDNFKEGEDPRTTVEMDIGINGFFDSINELADTIGLTHDKNSWVAFDDGKIICQQMETEEGFTPSKNNYKQFEEGKINLYACEYTFHIQFIDKMYTPTVDQLSMKLNIEEY